MIKECSLLHYCKFKGVQELEFSLKRIDWMNAREVVIKEHFTEAFITAANQLNDILDQNGRDNKNYRISIPGLGGMALVLTTYDAHEALCIQQSLIAIDF